MRSVESLGVGLKSPETGIGAEKDRPPAVLGAREVLRIGVVEHPAAERDEMRRPDGEQAGSVRHAPYFTSAEAF